MFKQIVSRDNLKKAYLVLASQIELDGRSGRYAGYDSYKLEDIDVVSEDILEEAREELLAGQELSPALLFKIPKKSNPQKTREVFIYCLKDRIKAQAIYQVVEAVFDAYLSPWLFSYRSSHPSYYAARSTVRHYGRYFSRDYVLLADAANYSSNIDRDILKEKLKVLDFSKEVLALLYLYIDNRFLKGSRFEQTPLGIISGTPLTGLFANLYLDELDKYAGRQVDFYRRVGDDLIAFDKEEGKIASLKEYLLGAANRLKVDLNASKTKSLSAAADFEYLGYHFAGGQVSFSRSFVAGTIRTWRQLFPRSDRHPAHWKTKNVKSLLNKEEQSLRQAFKQLVWQKNLVNDWRAIEALSEAFFRILTAYFFGSYTPRHRRLLPKYLKRLSLKSIYQYFLDCQYGYKRKTSRHLTGKTR